MSIALELLPGLPRDEVIQRLHFHSHRGGISDRALAYYLLEMKRSEHYRPGFRDAAHWARERLGDARGAQLIHLAERLEALPVIDGAFLRGEIPWTKVREIARVATQKTEELWLRFAKEASSRDLEAAVSKAKEGRGPGEGLELRRARRILRLLLPQRGMVLWEQALGKLREALGKTIAPSEAFVAALEVFLQREAGKSAGELSEEERGGSRRRGSPPPVAVVYHLGADGRSAWVDGEGGRAAVDPQEVEEALRLGAERLQVPDVAGDGQCAAIPFGKRGTAPPDERDRKISPELRRAVILRDGGRCVVCGSRQKLTVHHLDSHADGGETTAARLCCLCERCHADCHEGDLRLSVENGKIVARDREGRRIGRTVAPAEALSPQSKETPLEILEMIRRAEPPPPDPVPEEPSPPRPPSLRDLPPALSAPQWCALNGRVQWSASEHLFVLHPASSELEEEAAQAREAREAPEATETVPPEAGAAAAECASGSSPSSALRPATFDDIVGQARVVGNLLTAARAAAARGEPLEHVLLGGPSGLGKTTIARLLAARAGARLQETVGPHIGEPAQLISLLLRLQKGDFLFIDEIHALKDRTAECLYAALEDRMVHAMVREGSLTRTLRVKLEPFTLLGATTDLPALPKPLRGRFQIKEDLDPYSEEEIAEIVRRAARKLGVTATPEAAMAVAKRSRGTPREAIRILARARDLAQLRAGARPQPFSIELEHVVEASAGMGIDEHGLGAKERAVIALLLARGKPLGISAIAAKLGLDLRALEDLHEPWLERLGLLERTERGRVATERAWELYGETLGRPRGTAKQPDRLQPATPGG